MSLSSMQKGNIIESQVANLLMLVSDGRLTPSIPIGDDHGVDLIVTAKGGFDPVFLQVKSRFVTNRRYPKRVDFQVKRESLPGDPRLYVLCVYFDVDESAINCMWLIPSAELIAGAHKRPDHYRLAASRDPKALDKWSRYQVTPTKLVDILLAQLTGSWATTR